jgi:hypothetical protein
MNHDAQATADDSVADDMAGPIVRPYAITGGRVRSAAFDLDLVTLVVALRDRADIMDFVDLEPEHQQVLSLCGQPVSVAEVAARISLPLSVVKVLLGDLIEHRYLIWRAPMATARTQDPRVLQAVLDGIRDI